jgi:pectinesterase
MRCTAYILWLMVLAIGVKSAELHYNAIVAADGSGQFKSVQEAINAAPQNTNQTNRWVILIKPGTYRELVYVQREKRFVKLLGENSTNTVITYDLHAMLPGPDGKPLGTFRTPTMCIDADDFAMENLTVENSAGPVGQALAIRVDGDRVAFRNCRFLGWQDTVLLNRGRQYFESCFIAGHVDFIFGGATAWFEKCHIYARGNGYITAPSTPKETTWGFVFHKCKITGAPNAMVYLGRPWRDHGSATFLECEMSEVVRPEGWHNWGRPERETSARFAEYRSTGPGASPNARVKWAKQLSDPEARQISIKRVLGSHDDWNPINLLDP